MQSIEIKDIWDNLDLAIFTINIAGDVILANDICNSIFNADNFFDVIDNKVNLIEYLKQSRKIMGLELNINSKNRIININPMVKLGQELFIITIEKENKNIENEKTSINSVKVIAEMLSHEIKNPLSGIKGAAQLLHDELSPNNQELTKLIEFETTRIQNILDKMEMFSDEIGNLELLNIHEVLDHVITLLSNDSNIKINRIYDPSLPKIHANKNLAIQAFLNLVKNAIEASSDNSEIIVKTSFDLDPKINTKTTQKMPIIISIIDNGIGIDEEVRDNIFDPFVTTKPANSSGLGLSITAKLINDHNGIISCESKDNQTIFKVSLPMAKDIS